VGLLVSGYALGVAIAGPVQALATGRVSRKLLLLLVIVGFIIGNALCALSDAYWMLLGARLVVAACHGLFFGVAMVIATRLAPEGRQASAVSLVVAGVTIANVIGIPIGTAIGNAYGWRVTFWALSAAGAGAAALIWVLVPPTPADSASSANFRAEIGAALRPPVLLSYLIIALFMIGSFCILTYIIPLLTTVSGLPVEATPWVLFAVGVAGFFGNLVGGRLGDWNPTFTLAGIFACTACGMLVVTQVAPIGWAVTLALAGTWMVGFGFAAPVQSRILSEASDAPNFASTLISTAFNIGIATGAALASLAVAAGWDYDQLPFLSALFHGLALVTTLLLILYDRRQKAIPA
jgi:DHA1 family inner membrane transport protein